MTPSTVPQGPTASSITQYHKPSDSQDHSTFGDMCLSMPSSLRRAITSHVFLLVMGSSSLHEVACQRPPGRSEAGTNSQHHSPNTETEAPPSGCLEKVGGRASTCVKTGTHPVVSFHMKYLFHLQRLSGTEDKTASRANKSDENMTGLRVASHTEAQLQLARSE
ncbi:hypothetical protein CSPAE12_05971 [Colletotrichum incanum]|nr:hypothetical protein CSPAE12_05971 [Colletotrichum incanum]